MVVLMDEYDKPILSHLGNRIVGTLIHMLPPGKNSRGLFFLHHIFPNCDRTFFAALIWKSYDFYVNRYSLNLEKIMTVIWLRTATFITIYINNSFTIFVCVDHMCPFPFICNSLLNKIWEKL